MYKSFEKPEEEEEARDKHATKNQGTTYTVEDAVEHIGFGRFQLKIFFICGLFNMMDALELMLLAVLSPVVTCEWDLSDFQEGFITTAVFIGMFFGSILFGTLADKYGRLTIVRFACVWITYYGLLTTGSPDYIWLVFLRGMVGFGVGGAIQSFTLMGEYLPSKSRAKMLILFHVAFGLGSIFEVLMAYAILPTLSWRWLVGVSAMPMFLAIGAVLLLPRSARYLLAAGRQQEAESVLARAAAMNRIDMPKGNLVQSRKEARGNITELFCPEYRCTTLILLILWCATSFSYYGIVMLNSVILEEPGYCGSEDLASVAEECNLYTSEDYLLMVVANLGEFAAIPLNLATVDSLGRRRSLSLTFLGAALFFFLLLICAGTTWLTFFIFSVRTFASALFNIIYIYTAEVYPTTIRSIGIGINSSAARIGSMITPFIGQSLFHYSPTLSICVYGIVAVLCTILAMLLPIETKNRALLQTAHNGVTENVKTGT